MVNNIKIKDRIVIYQAKSGAIELRGDFGKETIWATQAQMTKLFNIDQSVVSRHIRNIFKDGEINEHGNMQKMHIPNSDKPASLYSLDILLAVGYRTNSKVAIEFRRWATKILKSYIVDGYAINKKRIAVNYALFLESVKDVKKLLSQHSVMNPSDAVELVTLFADTWLSLEAYDKDKIFRRKLTKRDVDLTAEMIVSGIGGLRSTLMGRSEATNIFGLENKAGSVAGIVGNVMQSFGGIDLYGSVEEKAANLLYFMVKDHPFIYGNKRSGAFAFIWFLREAGILDTKRITPEALTALTIMVAESDPKHREKVVKLILNVIAR